MNKEEISTHVHKNIAAYLATAFLGIVGVIFWGGVTSWLDTRHLLREEHVAAVNALKLEAKCNRYYENLHALTKEIRAANRRQSELRNYAREDSDNTDYNRARSATIEDLEQEKIVLGIEASQLKVPEGCEK